MNRSPVLMILHSFLQQVPAQRRENLVSFLSENEREALLMLPAVAEKPTADDFEHGEILEKVHWSWFLPTLKTYSARERSFFIAVLDRHSAKNLQRALSCKKVPDDISPVARSYLRQLLIASLIGAHDRLLPIDFLPASPLKGLLALSKNALIELIDCLAMHDLSLEMRQIVETKILKKIYSFLSEPQRQFLKHIGGRQEPILLAKMALDRWDGNEESLRHLLHVRGLMRLALALGGQDPDLIWYVCHQLDIGRGGALFKFCSREIPMEAAIRQVEELILREL